MFNWAKQQLANVAGTPEPIYGPSAIKPVATQATASPYTLLTRDDMKWTNMNDTSVETQAFYFTSDAGHIGMAQIIHSNVAGIRRTTQFNTKIMYPKSENKPHLWSSNDCSETQFIDNMTSFMAKDVAVLLSEDGKSYTIKAMINPNSLVNLKVTQDAPGFVVGQDGKTLYGTDMKKPWGSMRHAFWPRCTVEGAIVTKDGPIAFSGKSMFVHALQGMKPHHAAAKWRFGNFQGPTYSAVMMEYTTPPSYGSTVVNVGGIATDTEILMAGASNTAGHSKVKKDTQNDWPEPEEVKFEWNGKTKDGKTVSGVLEGPLGDRLDKIDVMVEVPAFVKQIAGQVAGTKPWIYQYSPSGLSLKLKIGDEEITEAGNFFSEATFICE